MSLCSLILGVDGELEDVVGDMEEETDFESGGQLDEGNSRGRETRIGCPGWAKARVEREESIWIERGITLNQNRKVKKKN